MGRRKSKTLDQDEAWPLLVWLFVRYEQKALETIFSDDAEPLIPSTEIQLALADDFLATATAFKEALETWLSIPGPPKVSCFVNDMLMSMSKGIHLAKEWRIAVEESERSRSIDKQNRDSWAALVLSVIFESLEKNAEKRRDEVAALRSKWSREQESLHKRFQKLVLRRHAITSDLLKRKVIASVPTDEELSRMKNPLNI
jgi:hypothetical protein